MNEGVLERFRPLFDPRGIIIAGASSHPGKFGFVAAHNVLSEGVKWMRLQKIKERGGDDVLKKYLKRFGPNWVETRGKIETPEFEVRLKPLNEFRALLEERGKFILIQGEEITDGVSGKPVHLNATNIKTLIQPLGGQTVREAILVSVPFSLKRAQR